MRKPIVKVIGQSEADLVPGWGPALESVKFTDNDGGEADEIEITFSVSAPFPDSPEEGTRYRLFYGWAADALRDAGQFTYQSDSLSGDAEQGYLMTATARSSDFVDADKAADTEHFEETTAGEIFQKLAKRSGKTAVIDKDIASVKIPYRLRHSQSASGFAAELAEELGGTWKPTGGRIVISKRGSGTTASGNTLPTIFIDFKQAHSIEITTEAKKRYAKTGGSSFDPLDGVQKPFEATSIGSASLFLGLHPARSEEEAEYATQAQGDELARRSASGSIDMDGDVNAMAGAPVTLSAFGPSRDASELVASTIEHTFNFDDNGGWTMSVAVGNRTKKKSKKKK